MSREENAVTMFVATYTVDLSQGIPERCRNAGMSDGEVAEDVVAYALQVTIEDNADNDLTLPLLKCYALANGDGFWRVTARFTVRGFIPRGELRSIADISDFDDFNDKHVVMTGYTVMPLSI